jgi:hypothetical protein
MDAASGASRIARRCGINLAQLLGSCFDHAQSLNVRKGAVLLKKSAFGRFRLYSRKNAEFFNIG